MPKRLDVATEGRTNLLGEAMELARLSTGGNWEDSSKGNRKASLNGDRLENLSEVGKEVGKEEDFAVAEGKRTGNIRVSATRVNRPTLQYLETFIPYRLWLSWLS